MSPLHIIVSSLLVAYLVGVLWLLYEMSVAPLLADHDPMGWDEWDEVESDYEIGVDYARQAMSDPTPLRVLVLDDQGAHHGTLNGDDSITVGRPFDWAGDAA